MKAQKTQAMEDQGARDRILKAGVGLFAENGYAATSVREIVSRAGVTKPVLYYYFGSKDGLFGAIIREAAARHEAVMNEVLHGSGSTLDRLTRLYDLVLAAVREQPNMVKLIYGLMFGPPMGAPEFDVKDFIERSIKAVKTIYREGVSRGEMAEADPDTVAFLVMALLDFSICFEFINPELSRSNRPLKMLRLAFQGLDKGMGER